jgi:hypothetical protein
MNHSFYSADRATHRRVLAAAFATAILVALLGVGLQPRGDQDAQNLKPAVVKAGRLVIVTDSGTGLVR